ncbi:MAG: carbon storage regulator CsrA [Proteobacteria bacterium]|nr:carbon storage regulator CsrA [Desulfobacula sp.]MBU3951408.1 carbon storage regulator CsrA [Pseudomonadota bacterium]MBU4130457.1 carbon storage regulator CsrA [Pseudomonadota bacterium]
MLVLTRRAEEKIKIGDNIIVSVLSVEGGVVKIGIDAPRDITILRMEVLEQIKNENIEAAQKGVEDIAQAVDLFNKKLVQGAKE